MKNQTFVTHPMAHFNVSKVIHVLALHYYYDNLVLTTIEKEVSQHHNFAYKN
jgi:hypothetical protein